MRATARLAGIEMTVVGHRRPRARGDGNREQRAISATPCAAATAKRLRQSAAALSSALPLRDRCGVIAATHETLHLPETP